QEATGEAPPQACPRRRRRPTPRTLSTASLSAATSATLRSGWRGDSASPGRQVVTKRSPSVRAASTSVRGVLLGLPWWKSSTGPAAGPLTKTSRARPSERRSSVRRKSYTGSTCPFRSVRRYVGVGRLVSTGSSMVKAAVSAVTWFCEEYACGVGSWQPAHPHPIPSEPSRMPYQTACPLQCFGFLCHTLSSHEQTSGCRRRSAAQAVSCARLPHSPWQVAYVPHRAREDVEPGRRERPRGE